MVLKMALKGKSPHEIAKFLNQNEIPTLGTAKFWTYEIVYKLLGNFAVTGNITLNRREFIDCRNKSVPLMNVDGYYPEIISKKEYAGVHKIRPRYKRTDKSVLKNIFAFLAKCPRCGSRMTKRKFEVVYLVCVKALNGAGCISKHVNLETLENAFALNIQKISVIKNKSQYRKEDNNAHGIDNLLGWKLHLIE